MIYYSNVEMNKCAIAAVIITSTPYFEHAVTGNAPICLQTDLVFPVGCLAECTQTVENCSRSSFSVLILIQRDGAYERDLRHYKQSVSQTLVQYSAHISVL